MTEEQAPLKNEADRRRDEALLRMLKTPPQPHNAPKKGGREPKPAPEAGSLHDSPEYQNALAKVIAAQEAPGA